MHDERKALGTTLDDLGIRDLLSKVPKAQTKNPEKGDTVKALWVPVSQVSPNPFQPRKNFSAIELEKLAQSIKAQGVLQPVVVRETPHGFELIAGERRLRATQIAGLSKIPVVVREISDQACLVLALIENIQREELNVIELAESLQSLAQRYGMTHAEVGKVIGKSRASVTNLIRLIQLHEKVKEYLAQGLLDMGHGRCLLGAEKDNQVVLADRIIQQGLSVRQSEDLVKHETQTPESLLTESRSKKNPLSPVVGLIKDRWSRFFGVGVSVKQHTNQPGGVVSLSYSSDEELEGIYKKIGFKEEDASSGAQ